MSPYLEQLRKQLNYDEQKSPEENIDIFYKSVKMLYYEWIATEVDGATRYYLDSPWKNEVGMQEITINFQKDFYKGLINFSMKNATDYPTILEKCKERLLTINHYYSPSFTDILILNKPEVLSDCDLIVEVDSLPDPYKLSIERSYELLLVLFKKLESIVLDEIRDFQLIGYVRDKSNYTWVGNKNELSELALSLFLSGAVKNRNGKELKMGTFARELSAFLGLDKLNFDQDIASITYKTHGSRTEFINSLKRKNEEYFAQRVENQY